MDIAYGTHLSLQPWRRDRKSARANAAWMRYLVARMMQRVGSSASLILMRLFVFALPLASLPEMSWGQEDLLDSLETIASSTTRDTTRVNALTHLAFLVYRTSPEKTKEYGTQALKLAEELSYKEGIAQSNSILGIYYWACGDYQEAFTHQLIALRSFDELGDSTNVANVSLNIGAIYTKQGDYDKALEHFLFSVRIHEALNDSQSMADAYNNIAVVMKNQERYDKALEYYMKAMNMYQDFGDSIHLAMSLYNIGAVNLSDEHYDQALIYLGKALDIEKGLHDIGGISKTYVAIGNVYLWREDYETSLDFFLESLDLMEQMGDKSGIAITRQNIGMLYEKLGDYEKAEDNLRRALNLSREIGARNTEKATLLALSNLEASKDNYQSSLEYYKEYTALKDGLFNAEKSELIAEMRTRYEMERKEHEIQLLMLDKETKAVELRRKQETLRRHRILLSFIIVLLLLSLVLSTLLYRQYKQKTMANVLLAQQKEELAKQRDAFCELNATKDKFFTIIAHDLRNPFSALISISRSLSESHHDITEEERHTYLKTLNQSANRLYKLLENLLQWARTQTGDIDLECERIDLSDIASRCVDVLESSARERNTHVSSRIEQGAFVYADPNMVKAVLRNLLDNAIKFTREGGTVSIEATPNEDYIEVSVVDDGSGISEQDIGDLFRIEAEHTHIGSTKDKGTGLGLILCKEFVEINGGKIWVESKLGGGSSFRFTLRRKPPCPPAIDK